MKNYNRELKYIFNSPWFIPFEMLHVKLLKHFRLPEKYPLMTVELFQNKVAGIINKAYKSESPELYQIDSIYKILNYCCAIDINQIYYYLTDQSVLLVTSYYNCFFIVEMAAVKGKCNDSVDILMYLSQNFKIKPFVAFCNTTDSWPLITALARQGRIKIIKDYYDQKKEAHCVKFRFVRHRR